MLTVVEKVIFLQGVDVFGDIPTEQLSYVAAIAEPVDFLKDEDVYTVGEAADALYFILDGKVRLHREGSEIGVVDKEEVFGAWSLFYDEPRLANATVLEDSRLLRIGREEFMEVLSDHTRVMQGILKSLASQLRALLDRVGADLQFPKDN